MLQNGRGASRKVGKRHVAQPKLVRASRVQRATPRLQRASRTHGWLESQHGSDWRSGSVERPTESAKRNHRNADGALHVHHSGPQSDSSVCGAACQHPEHRDIRADYQKQAPDQRPLAQSCGSVLQLVQTSPSRNESLHDPAGESKQPQFLARGRIHGKPISVVGITLRAAYLFGVAVAPDSTFTQKPMRGRPSAREQDWRPPRISGKNHGAGNATDHLHHAAGDKIHGNSQRRARHSEVEVARHSQVARQFWIFQMADPGWAHTRLRESVVKPSSRTVAQIGAYRLMNRAEYLKKDNNCANKRERTRERIAALHGADKNTHRNGKCRRQCTSEQKSKPPREGNARSCLW